tara:strand:+ start:87 stop:245 length:159 start_codon:yes stop_codon:yes gene_type:complete
MVLHLGQRITKLVLDILPRERSLDKGNGAERRCLVLRFRIVFAGHHREACFR